MASPVLEGEMLSWGRVLLDGIPFADLLEAQRRDASIAWLDFWMGKAAHYEELGEQALDDGHDRSAGEWLWLASLCCHCAQFYRFDERRWQAQRRRAELYRLAAPYLAPPVDRVELPSDGVTIAGYLRLPSRVAGPVGCAIVLGGLDSATQESHRFGNLLLERGVATFTFDQWGQGEPLEHVPLGEFFDRYTSVVLDHLVQRPELGPGRIGVLGRDVGGHFALRSACLDDRLAACVSWGGFVDMETSDTGTPTVRDAWRYVSMAVTEETAHEIAQAALDARSVLGGLRCPTYVLHGALGEVPLRQVQLLRELATNAELTIVVEPAGDQGCDNLGPEPRVAMADWLADRLT